MRTRLMATLCGILAFVPAASRAQPKRQVQASPTPAETDDSASEGSSETQGVDVVDEPAPNKPPNVALPGRETAPGEVHTVVKGDTLWDLSQKYLGSPWYWPKVWSYNPAIANPHWIYPGNAVRFFPAGAESPARVEVGEAPNEAPTGSDEGLNSADMIQPEGGESTVEVAGPIGYQPKAGGTQVRNESFVTPKELAEAGKLDSSFSERTMLSLYDTVYVSFANRGKVKLGDKFVIFRTLKEIDHPATGDDYGYLTQFVGTAKVTKLGKSLVTAQITEAWDEIRRGDLVGPFGERLVTQVSPRANERDIKGYVLTPLVPYLTILGEHHSIVIDKGSADGVQPGNSFTVIRQGDGDENMMHPQDVQNEELPTEDVASCMAVDVKEKASTCLLTRSLREVVIGDRVEMRKGNAGSAPLSLRP